MIKLTEIFTECETEDWQKFHHLGPVHVDIVCNICKEKVCENMQNYGHIKGQHRKLFSHLGANHSDFLSDFFKIQDDLKTLKAKYNL